jgi:Translation initiation factor IF-2, N-terminal region
VTDQQPTPAEAVTIRDLSLTLHVPMGTVVKALMNLGTMKTVTQPLTDDEIALITEQITNAPDDPPDGRRYRELPGPRPPKPRRPRGSGTSGFASRADHDPPDPRLRRRRRTSRATPEGAAPQASLRNTGAGDGLPARLRRIVEEGRLLPSASFDRNLNARLARTLEVAHVGYDGVLGFLATTKMPSTIRSSFGQRAKTPIEAWP